MRLLNILVVLLLLCIRATAAFFQSYTLNTVSPATAVVVTSMAGPTNQDAAVALDGSILVLTNNGTGRLSSNSVVPVAGQPVALTSGLFYTNVTPAIVCASFLSNTLSILTNAPAFITTTIYSTNSVIGTNSATYTTNIIGYTNSTIVTNVGAIHWFPLPAHANRTYVTNNTYGTNTTYTTNAGTVYTNSVVTSSNNVTFTGSRTFGLSYSAVAGGQPSAIASGSVSGGTNLDMVCANAGDSTIMMFTNNGFGLVSPRVASITTNTSLVVSNYFSWFSGTNLMTVTNTINLVSTNTSISTTGINGLGLGPVSVAMAYIILTNLLDVLTANEQDGTMSWFTNSGNNFGLCANYAVGTYPTSVKTFTNASISAVQIVVANSGTNFLSLFTVTNHRPLFVTNLLTDNGPQMVSVIGNGTTNIELVCVTLTNGLAVLTNNASGGFATAYHISTGKNPRYVVNSDLRHSGFKDLLLISAVAPNIVTNNGTNYSVVYSNSITVFTNNQVWP